MPGTQLSRWHRTIDFAKSAAAVSYRLGCSYVIHEGPAGVKGLAGGVVDGAVGFSVVGWS